MGDSSSESEDETFSGFKQPTLLEQIKTILDEYRNDVQIIKELVQNADDAEATQMSILYEGNNPNERQVKDLTYGKFLKTPALIFYNDAKFNDNDWEGIRAIYNSVKKDDPLKIGRFGLGFKSVFHMTDNPCIISGENVLFIDPLERKCDKVCAMMKLRSWKKGKNRGYFNTLNGTFGFDENTIETGSYPGTMFWFSLRQTPSSLSDDIYAETEVLHLLEAFISESSRSLLFLKTLCSVKMYVNLLEKGEPQSKKKKLNKNEITNSLKKMNFGKEIECYSVNVDNVQKDLVQKKIKCLGDLKRIGRIVPKESIHWTFDIFVSTIRKKKNEKDKVAKARWLIVNYLKGGQVDYNTRELLEDEELRCHNLVGLAAPIKDEGVYKIDAGHIFCYQPLPQDSSSVSKLPVHLNAFFALSQNRRQIKWPDKDDKDNFFDAQGDKKIMWNLALATEMFPEAYHQLETELVEVSKKGGNKDYLVDAVYNSVPSIEDTDPRWKNTAERYIRSCKNQAILYTRNDGGKWVNLKNAIFVDFKRVPSTRKECEKTVLSLMLQDGINIIKAPDHVIKSFESVFRDLTFVTPHFVRNHLKTFPTYKNLSFNKKQDLLQFIMLDSSQHSLNSLELLPVADNSFMSFSTSNVYVEDKDIIDLFPDSKKEFVSADVRPEVQQLLSKLADNEQYRLQRVIDAAFIRLIENASKTNKTKVPISQKQKHMLWIKGIWTLIRYRFKTSMHKFIDLPIFPVVKDYDFLEEAQLCLLPLKSNMLYVPSFRKLDNNEIIFKAMGKLNVTITAEIPEWLDYSLVESYLPKDTSEGLVSLFSRVNIAHIENFNDNSKIIEAETLRKFLSERIQCHTDVSASKNIFKKLKLFRGYISKKEYKIVSVKECNKLYERMQVPVTFPERFLGIKSEIEISFAKRLGIEIRSELDIVSCALDNFENYAEKEKQILMRWIIKEKSLFRDAIIQNQMKKIEFLMGTDGWFYKPCDLFDPTDTQLKEVFKGQSVFPKLEKHKVDNEFLSGLKKLGLKSRTEVTSQDIENVCLNVEETFLEKAKCDPGQCQAILSFLNENNNLIIANNLFDKQFIMIKRITDVNYPDDCVPIKNNTLSKPMLCSPMEVKSTEFRYLVGSAVYMINCEALHNLSQALSWQTEPSVNSVLEHLFNVVKGYKSDLKFACISMIVKIYKWLSKQHQCDRGKLRKLLKDKFSTIQETYIWVGDGFQAPNYVYVEEKEADIDDMKPLLHVLPTEFSNIKTFFVAIGCSKVLDFDMYLETLYRIKEETDTGHDRGSKRKLRKLAIAILNKIKDDFMDEFRESKKELYFPVMNEDNKKMSMKPTKQCTYCDAQWLRDMDIGLDDDVFYIHPDVPAATAESLGVPSLRQQMLSSTEALEEWGQEEPLTRRLRNLLKDGYVDGFSFAKELFQNADDAGAKMLHILFDERENVDAKTHLISDNMAECQGPALWVYNDAKFTEEDFENITKLSGGTKENDSTKIGKFGLGFCSVYNVTDVPSFVSGDNVVMFDPHTTFLGKALPGKSPGLRINFKVMKNRNMMKKLKNQFKPFDRIFDCKLTDGVSPRIEGTLFRLPLRTKGSEICDIVYTPSEVKALFEKIMKMAANMLLFSQHVGDIKLFHLKKSAKNPSRRKVLYETSKSTSLLMSDLSFSGKVLEEASKRKNSKTLAKNPVSVVENVNIKVLINHVASFELPSITHGTTIESDWLVGWSTRSDKKMLELSYSEKGAINLGAVAVPVCYSKALHKKRAEIIQINAVPGFYDTGHLFFFLPLPIKHSFPFHVNSPFLVSNDRKRLQISTEDDKNIISKEWNESLLAEPVTYALLYLLENIESLESLRNYNFHQLWPLNESDPTLKCLQLSFYKKVAEPKAHKVFEKNGSWFDISKCVFIESNLRSSCVGDIAFEVLSSLITFVVDIPTDIYNSLLEANGEFVRKKTVKEEQFFLEYFFKNLTMFQGKEDMIRKRNSLLKYAIKQTCKFSSIAKWMKSNKCIPSRPTGLLQCPYDMIDPCSQLADLFSLSDERFPSTEFCQKDTLDTLRKNGLMSKLLTDQIVVDRARSIQTLQRKCSKCAAERVGHLLAYLCENGPSHKAIYFNLQKISFIPVKCKPNDWRFRWEAESLLKRVPNTLCSNKHSRDLTLPLTAKFTNTSNIYHNRCKDIVGCVALVFEEGVCKFARKTVVDEKLVHFLKEIGMKGIPFKDVELKVVINQLEAISSHRISDVNKELFVERVIGSIYDYLEDSYTPDSDPMFHKLRERPLVYVSRTFTFPKNVARYVERDCQPYFFKLKDSPLRHYSNLCRCFGIKDRFKPLDFAHRVQQVKIEKKDKPLTSSEITTIINILTCLGKSIKPRGNVKRFIGETLQAIYGPDENGILRDCASMCLNDFDDIEKSESMIYAHEEFTHGLAKQLGVKPKVIQDLDDHSEDIEDFYQEEPLLTRLQRLVEGYPCETGIFKELLQNADDAKATEIIFIKDEVSHPSRNIFEGEGFDFKPLQGPALCVFNNSSFSNEDLNGIQKLGRGSKSDDPTKTGRYGVGFNAVYNLTDAPSFYTKGEHIANGETLCIFDPLAKFIPNVTKRKPGKRYKNVKLIKRHHSDMLSGYHEKFFGKKGTVFRFPLRTSEMAETSEIKQETVTIETISDLLNDFCNELGEVVLFLKNLRTVRIVTHTSQGYKEDFSITLELNEKDRIKINDIAICSAEMCKEIVKNPSTLLPYQQKSWTYELHTIEKWRYIVQKKTYIIVQTLGFQDGNDIPDILMEALINKKIGLYPHGGVVFCAGDFNTGVWNYRYVEGTEKKAFCFLPLPLHTGLPVHVHGYFSLDHESRRTLWKSESSETCYRTVWNNSLIESVIAPAYVQLLQYMQKKMFDYIIEKDTPFSTVSRVVSNYQTLFPLVCRTEDCYWKHLVCCVYKELADKHVSFLPSQETRDSKNPSKSTTLKFIPYKPINHVYPAFTMKESSVGSPVNIDSDFNNILRRLGMKIVFVTEHMTTSMAASGVGISAVDEKTLIDFLVSFKSSHVDKCKIETQKSIKNSVLKSTRNVESVLEFCLKNEAYLLEHLTDIPLMVTEDKIVRSLQETEFLYVISENSGRFNNFFPTKKHLFLTGSIAYLLYNKYKDDLFKVASLKQFGLEDFVSLVEETGVIKKSQLYLFWDKKRPDVGWIRLFWKLFSHLSTFANNEFKTNVVETQMELICLLPLIPAVELLPKQNFLIPPSDIKRLLNIDSFHFNFALQTVFTRLDIPHIDAEVLGSRLDDKSYDLIKRLIPSSENPNDVLECLHLNLEKLRNAFINTDEARTILRYFNDQHEKLTSNAIQQLLQLPLFETYSSELVELSGHSEKIVMKQIPSKGLENLKAVLPHVLFLVDTELHKLFGCLGIKRETWIEVYEKYIIPNQQYFTREEFYKHIEFLSLQIDSPCHRLIALLRDTAFVETSDKTHVRVCELFDCSHILFRTLCKKSELVPNRLKTKCFLDLFRLLGMKTEMSMELFIRFAKYLEEGGNTDKSFKKVSLKSEKLLSHLFNMKATFFQRENFDELNSIKFITPFVVDGKISTICPQFNCKTLVCFSEAVLNSSTLISWTIANILPDEADPTKQNVQLADMIIDKLNICKAPTVKKLIQHFAIVSGRLCKKRENRHKLHQSTVQSALKFIYQALDEHNKSGLLTEVSVEPLKTTKTMYLPASQTMVMAGRLVNSCREEEDIPPFLNKCPVEFVQFQDLFLLLGAKQEPTAEVYAEVLNNICMDCGISTRLSPKESYDGKKAMKLFFKYLIQQNGEIRITDNKLYLLCDDETFEASQMLIFGNNRYFEKQLAKVPSKHVKLLFPIENLPKCDLKIEDCVNSIKNLPDCCRPYLLTDLVKEHVLLHSILNKDDTVAIEVENFIHSRFFIEGFLRLIRHVYTTNTKNWNSDEEKRLASLVKNVSFQHASGIETSLLFTCILGDKKGKDIPIENTNEAKYVHLEVSDDKTCIYFDTSDETWFSKLAKQLTIHLNSQVCKCLKDETFILMDMISMKDSPAGISDFLSKEKIEEYSTSIEINEGLTYPVPGTFVQKFLHKFLDNDYGVIFEYEYKFIALEVDDPDLLSAQDEDTDEAETDSELIYIFVHIVRKLENNSDLPLLQEYEINDGTENHRIVKAYQLFKFVRKENQDQNKEVVIYESPVSGTVRSSLKEAKREIRKNLREAYTKEKCERRQIVNRLILKWHPDKNPDNVQFCTKVFQYIQQCILRLKNGEELVDDEDDDDDDSSNRSRGYSFRQSWSRSWYGRYWKRRDRWWQNYASSGSSSQSSHTSSGTSNQSFRNFNHWWFNVGSHTSYEEEPFHWYSEARRWMRQANSDLTNAEASMQDSNNHSFNWICYKAHQGAEKSLKAAWYAKDANKIRRIKYSHNLFSLSSGLHQDLAELSSRLSSEAGDHSRMRYPDMLSGQQIPAEAYTREKAVNVLELSRKIIATVQEKHIQ